MTGKFVYQFSAWPHERGFGPEMFILFDMLNKRAEIVLTEQEFDSFRDAVNRHGITLREIERRPYSPPERVL